MNIVRVFNWFCKEQHILGEVYSAFNKLSPKQYRWFDGRYTRVDMRYFDYVKCKMSLYSPIAFFHNFKYDLLFSSMRDIGYECVDGDIESVEIFKGYKNVCKRWSYFVKNNVFLNEESLKEGDVVYYGSTNKKAVVDIIDVGEMLVTLKPEGWDKRVRVLFSDLRNENNEELNIDFYIKRNGRKYYGVGKVH